MIPRIAVLTFPGNNCENETCRSLRSVGFVAQKVRWNSSSEDLLSFDGVVIPGGFSFEDRGRSGVISAQEPILKILKKMAKEGKPIMGICNGAQILVESGLILETVEEIPALALLKNKRINENGEVLGTGFYHSWSTLKPVRKDTPFSYFDNLFNIPIAHGEGRFTIPEHLQSLVAEKSLIVFQYVDEAENPDSHYPVNPNGSFDNAAAMCNISGNVMAIMPHPERSENGKVIFESLWRFFEEKKNIEIIYNPISSFEERLPQKDFSVDIEILVSLNITDNTERTYSKVLKNTIHRFEMWRIKGDVSLSELEILLRSGDLLNLNKQSVKVCYHGVYYFFDKTEGFQPLDITSFFEEKTAFRVQEKEDFKASYTLQHLQKIFPFLSLSFGVVWQVPFEKYYEYSKNPLFASYIGEEVFVV